MITEQPRPAPAANYSRSALHQRSCRHEATTRPRSSNSGYDTASFATRFDRSGRNQPNHAGNHFPMQGAT